MKKTIIALLCFVLLVSFGGCAKDATVITSDMPQEKEANTLLFFNQSKSGDNILTMSAEVKEKLQSGRISIEENFELPPPDEIEINLCAIGDIMAHEGTYNSAKRTNGYDFTNMFAEIAPYVKDSDYIFGNLETTFSGSGRGYSGYPTFNTPEQMGYALKTVLGVDLVSHANNHTLDCGFNGVVSTLAFLDEYGIAHTGSYAEETAAQKYHMEDIKGAKIAFTGYTYGSNNPVKKSFSLNLINKEQIKADAARAKEDGAQYVIAMLHWGVEYKRYASDEQKKLARWIYENTEVDLIVGNHAHVTEPIEEIKYTRNGVEKTGIVFYALGNFTGAQRWEYTDTGIIANIKLIIDPANSDNNRIEQITYTPTFIDPNDITTGKRYRVVAIEKAISDYEKGLDPLISTEEYNRIKGYKEAYREMLEIYTYIQAS